MNNFSVLKLKFLSTILKSQYLCLFTTYFYFLYPTLFPVPLRLGPSFLRFDGLTACDCFRVRKGFNSDEPGAKSLILIEETEYGVSSFEETFPIDEKEGKGIGYINTQQQWITQHKTILMHSILARKTRTFSHQAVSGTSRLASH